MLVMDDSTRLELNLDLNLDLNLNGMTNSIITQQLRDDTPSQAERHRSMPEPRYLLVR